jgi:hypothetical protein
MLLKETKKIVIKKIDSHMGEAGSFVTIDCVPRSQEGLPWQDYNQAVLILAGKMNTHRP